MKMWYTLLILILTILVLPASAGWYNTSTEGVISGGHVRPGTPYRLVPEEIFSNIRSGIGNNIYEHPTYNLTLKAGSTIGTFIELSRPVFFGSGISTIGLDEIIDDAYLTFSADTFTTFGDFEMTLTSGTSHILQEFDQTDYNKFGNIVLTDNVTVSGNGTQSYSFHFNQAGIDYLNDMRVSQYIEDNKGAPLYLRLVWDVNNQFDGTWSDGGNVTVNVRQSGPTIYHRAYLNLSSSVASLPPRSYFICNLVSGVAPFSTDCYDYSLYVPTSWNFSVDNGQISHIANPTFLFNDVGVYDVNLTVCNALGCDIRIRSGYITVVAPFTIGHTIANTNASTIDWFSNGLVRNSTGALYTVFNDDQGGFNFLCYLAWSTDEGITWNKTPFDCNGEPSIAIDSQDKISITYHQINDYAIRYRNYTVADGFGTPYVISNPANMYVFASQAVDSTGKVHIVFIGLDTVTWDYIVEYRNISPTHELGDIVPLDRSTELGWPIVCVGNGDIVHIVWPNWAIGGGATQYGFLYKNITASGFGDTIRMSEDGGYEYQYRVIMDSTDKLHLMYKLWNNDNIYYVNTTAGQNFQITGPMIIGTSSEQGMTMTKDLQNTLHFIWSDVSNGLYYRNLTSSGISNPVLIDNTAIKQVYVSAPYALVPSGQIREKGIEFIVAETDAYGHVFYAEYPPDYIPPLTPAPTNPFNSVTVESTSQLVQTVIQLGLMLSILATIAMLVMKFIVPGE